MSSPIISVENLGKRYTIRHQANGARGGYRRLSEELSAAATKPFRALARRWGQRSAISDQQEQTRGYCQRTTDNCQRTTNS